MHSHHFFSVYYYDRSGLEGAVVSVLSSTPIFLRRNLAASTTLRMNICTDPIYIEALLFFYRFCKFFFVRSLRSLMSSGMMVSLTETTPEVPDCYLGT